MNYLLEKEKWVEIDNNCIYTKTYKSYLKNLAEINLRDLKSLRRITSKLTGIKRNIPIYLSETILLSEFVLPDKKHISINAFNVSSYIIKDEMSVIFFNDGTNIFLEVSSYKMKKNIKNIKIVMNKLKHLI